jgi:hypothetical protein
MPCVVLPLAMPIVVASSSHACASGEHCFGAPARGNLNLKGSGGADGPCALPHAQRRPLPGRLGRRPLRARPAATTSTASISEGRVQVGHPPSGGDGRAPGRKRQCYATAGEGQGPTRAFPPTRRARIRRKSLRGPPGEHPALWAVSLGLGAGPGPAGAGPGG